MNKKIIYVLLGLFFSSQLIFGNYPQQNEIDGVAAIVGNKIILKSEVIQLFQMAMFELKLNSKTNDKKLRQLNDQMLNNLINQKLMLEIAEEESIEVKEAEVDRALEQQINTMVTRLGSEENVEKTFGKSLKQIRREYWSEMKDQLITEKYQENLLKDISVTRDDVKYFFKQYKDSLISFPQMYNISHILFNVKPGKKSREKAYNFITSLRKKILNNEISFEEAARLYSNDPGSAKHGGDLGLVSRGMFVPEFEEVAFSLKKNEISDVIVTEFGYHIIELIEKIGEKINVRHILITPQLSDFDEDSVYNFANTIRDSIISGNDFSSFAKKYSDDLITKTVGGKLGWINQQSFKIKNVLKVLPTLEIGSISNPIRASDGYHLVLIHDIKKGGSPNLDTHWSEIEQMALAKKRSDFFNEWIKKKKSSVFIKIMN